MVVVRDREGAGELIVERDVALVVPPERAVTGQRIDGIAVDGNRAAVHDRRAFGITLIRLKEAVHAAAVELLVARAPLVVRIGHAEHRRVLPGVHRAARRVRLLGVHRRVRRRLDVAPVRVLIQMAEVRVERPILLHQDDDVLDRDLGVDRELAAERFGG